MKYKNRQKKLEQRIKAWERTAENLRRFGQKVESFPKPGSQSK